LVNYELIILGQGSAAFAAAIKADELGVDTAMVGGNATKGTVIGGTCVNVGCVPSKRLITVGTLFHEAMNPPFGGIKYGEGRVEFGRVIREKDRLVSKLRKEKYEDVLKNLRHVTYYRGTGRFVSRNRIEVGKEILQTDKVLVATGARANLPSIEGIGEVDCLTSEEALSLRKLPDTLCVIGGRALGLEFAQMYAQFGANVVLLQRSERILPEDEPEVSSALTGYLREMGVRVFAGAKIVRVAQKENKKWVDFNAGGKSNRIICDHILVATGRKPNTEELNLDKAGVRTDDKGFVIVNGEMRTTSPNIWAAGDVVGEPMLETLAAKQGSVAVNNAFTTQKRRIDLNQVPSAVFTYPEVAKVGLTESKAHEKKLKCSCVVLPLEFVPKAQVTGDTRGLVKLVVESETKRIVGVHMVAPHAADLIHAGVLAVKNGLTIDDIIDTVHVFPTLSEAFKLAAQSFYSDIRKLSCCTE
jgi:mercuric reductase